MRFATLTMVRSRAEAEIDAAAGRARLRYITDVPGQQAVYITKLGEAEEYLAGMVNDVPTVQAGPYLVAEAAVRGISQRAMAEMVVGLAGQWNGIVGPAIEAARMAGKLAVQAAPTIETVEAARDAAVASLNTL